VLRLDNRGLVPPEPMMRILEALEQLNVGGELEVINERRPMFLYPILAEQGFVCDTEEQPDGLVRLRIRRREG
jgi:tRNA 2-thiouridine synthesizing protein A